MTSGVRRPACRALAGRGSWTAALPMGLRVLGVRRTRWPTSSARFPPSSTSTPAKHTADHIQGAVDVELESLRQRLSDLQDCPLVVHCAVGSVPTPRRCWLHARL